MNLNKSISTPIAILLILVFSSLAAGLIWQYKPMESPTTPAQKTPEAPEGIMVLIEYESIDGLSNMINELQKRDIHALLYVTPSFVEDNCEAIKKINNYDVKLVGSCGEPLWNLSKEEQRHAITETKNRIESCTGESLNFITSRYWGWDENTVKLADELGIEHIFARGMVGNGAAVFKPEEYNVKMLSVSNIEDIKYKYGSVCDYSFWVRDGEPSDMKAELNDAITNNDKVTPVSHTNVGGLKKKWLNMWKEFFDSGKVNWVSWEEFSEVDYEMPLNRIPANQNVPYTPEMEKELEDEDTERDKQDEEVENPCTPEDLPETDISQDSSVDTKGEIIMFHNDSGPMCLEAKDFFEENNIEYEEVLNTEEDFRIKLNEYKQEFSSSEGESDSFGYYPIIFIGDDAYSGFNEEVKQKILNQVK